MELLKRFREGNEKRGKGKSSFTSSSTRFVLSMYRVAVMTSPVCTLSYQKCNRWKVSRNIIVGTVSVINVWRHDNIPGGRSFHLPAGDTWTLGGSLEKRQTHFEGGVCCKDVSPTSPEGNHRNEAEVDEYTSYSMWHTRAAEGNQDRWGALS